MPEEGSREEGMRIVREEINKWSKIIQKGKKNPKNQWLWVEQSAFTSAIFKACSLTCVVL